MRCFTVPGGVAVKAEGMAKADAKAFHMAADVGSVGCGIQSHLFLDKVMKTVRYELPVTPHKSGKLSYKKDTQLPLAGSPEGFHHKNQNSLKRAQEPLPVDCKIVNKGNFCLLLKRKTL